MADRLAHAEMAAGAAFVIVTFSHFLILVVLAA